MINMFNDKFLILAAGIVVGVIVTGIVLAIVEAHRTPLIDTKELV